MRETTASQEGWLQLHFLRDDGYTWRDYLTQNFNVTTPEKRWSKNSGKLLSKNVKVRIAQHTCGGQKTTCGNWFSPSTLWVLMSGLVAHAFT